MRMNEDKNPHTKEMRKVIRSICVMLAVLFCLQIVPPRGIVKEIEAETANVYDPGKAVAWATNASNFINGNYLCAHFVSYCLQHGGLTDVDFGYPGTLAAYVEQQHYGKRVILSDQSIANLKAGDFIVVFCELHCEWYGIHTIFVTEVNQEQGYLRYSAKNDFHCNEVMTFQKLKNYSSYFTCLHHGDTSVITTYIVSMYTSQSGDTNMYTSQPQEDNMYIRQSEEVNESTNVVHNSKKDHLHQVYDERDKGVKPDSVNDADNLIVNTANLYIDVNDLTFPVDNFTGESKPLLIDIGCIIAARITTKMSILRNKSDLDMGAERFASLDNPETDDGFIRK